MDNPTTGYAQLPLLPDEPVTKRCAVCLADKPLEQFSIGRAYRLGRQPKCKECDRAYGRKYRQENREADLARHRQYRQENADKVREYHADYRRRKPEVYRLASARYRKQHPTKAKLATYKWAQANKERRKVVLREWREKNAERIREWREGRRDRDRELLRQWRKNHPTRARALIRGYQARKRGALAGNVDYTVIWERDNGICHICGLPVPTNDVHFDHVIPLSRGGAHSMENVAVAHSMCNLRKHNKLLSEM